MEICKVYNNNENGGTSRCSRYAIQAFDEDRSSSPDHCVAEHGDSSSSNEVRVKVETADSEVAQLLFANVLLPVNANRTCDTVVKNSVTSVSRSSCTTPVTADDSSTDKREFFRGFGLTPAQTQPAPRRSPADLDYDVIVIDDEDEQETNSSLQIKDEGHRNKSVGVVTPKHSRNERQTVTDNTLKNVQPCNRLRRLLDVELSSPLGHRLTSCITTLLKKGENALHPCTVAHSLAGINGTLAYDMFCRTPVKAAFSGRLRSREFPVRFKRMATSHCHQYCFSRANRREFCLRFDTGLDARSRRLRRRFGRCFLSIERLTSDEIADWRSSQRLRDYVEKMQAKDAEMEARRKLMVPEDEVIAVSSDSEDEAPVAKNKTTTTAAKLEAFVFRCHKCGAEISCGDRFRELVRSHYGQKHGIFNIDLVNVPQPDGTTALNIVQVEHSATTLTSQQPSPAFRGVGSASRPRPSTRPSILRRPPVSVPQQLPLQQNFLSQSDGNLLLSMVSASGARNLILNGARQNAIETSAIRSLAVSNGPFRCNLPPHLIRPSAVGAPVPVSSAIYIPYSAAPSAYSSVPRRLFVNNVVQPTTAVTTSCTATVSATSIQSSPASLSDSDVICID